MKPVELKVARIGNSRGVRLPADTLTRYGIGDTVLMEERDEGILLRPRGGTAKLSWEDTAKAMAASDEDWSEWDPLASDGLEAVPWDDDLPRRVAEAGSRRRKKRHRPK